MTGPPARVQLHLFLPHFQIKKLKPRGFTRGCKKQNKKGLNRLFSGDVSHWNHFWLNSDLARVCVCVFWYNSCIDQHSFSKVHKALLCNWCEARSRCGDLFQPFLSSKPVVPLRFQTPSLSSAFNDFDLLAPLRVAGVRSQLIRHGPIV